MHASETIEWDRQAIIAEVRRRGSTIAAIGREIGLKRPTMSWALISPHPRANKAIADFLDEPLHVLWPQWFDEDGKLISTQPVSRPAFERITRGVRPSRLGKRAA